jgi:hypothetical protein
MWWEILLFVFGFLGGHVVSQWLSFKYSVFLWANRAIILFIIYKLRQLKISYKKLIYYIKRRILGEKESFQHENHHHHHRHHQQNTKFNIESLFKMLFDNLNLNNTPFNILPTSYSPKSFPHNNNNNNNLHNSHNDSHSLDILESGNQQQHNDQSDTKDTSMKQRRKPLQKPSDHLVNDEE